MQGMLIDLQQRLSSALAEQQGAQQSLAVYEQKLHTLEIEKRLAESTETRMTAEIAQVGILLALSEAEACNHHLSIESLAIHTEPKGLAVAKLQTSL